MHGFLNFATLLFSLFAGQALSLNGCRQCSGTVTLTFPTWLDPPRAQHYFDERFSACATHSDYTATKGARYQCQCTHGRYAGCEAKGVNDNCRQHTWTVQAWRYCGNGGKVDFNKNFVPQGFPTNQAFNFKVAMTCTHSVICKGDCNCSDCGC